MYRLLPVKPITLHKIVNFSVNPKKPVGNFISVTVASKLFLFISLILFFALEGLGQVPDSIAIAVSDSTVLDTLQLPALPASDTLQLGDTLTTNVRDSIPIPKGDIDTTIKYTARDSMKFSVDGKKVYLYGDAKITYGEIKMEAERVEVDYAASTITANGIVTEFGEKIGMPVFHNGAETYVTKGMVYNFKTGNAKIKDVVTTQGDGYIRGEEVFKNEDNELFSFNNTYTTCNLEHPHFRIRSKRTKAIPNDKIVSGPFNLEINDVPTPLGFAFGLFPAKQEASSGIIIPSYGEERRRGFFLRGGGYFFDISDYVKIRLTGDIYTKGGHGLSLAMPYRKRYKYSGGLTFNYTQQRLSDDIEDLNVQNDYRLQWNFTPQTKGPSRFSASVNAATSSFNTNNNLGVRENANRKLNSNVNYNKTFRGTPFSMGINLRHSQDVATKELDLTLPSFNVNMENIYPFKKKGGSSKTWYQKMAFRWNLKGENHIDNRVESVVGDVVDGTNSTDNIVPFTLENLPTFIKDGKQGLVHDTQLNTSLSLLKYFKLNPSFRYSERWYFKRLDWSYDEELEEIVSEEISGFNRLVNYSGGFNITTGIFGTKFFKKGKIKAIRHAMTPSIGFNYAPNFRDTTRFDYVQVIENPNTGALITRSRYDGFLFASSPGREQAAINFNLNNTLEMKVKDEEDSVKQFKKVKLLNSFGISTNYNVIAEEFKLGNIRVNANTSLFQNKLSVNFTGTIDPYIYRLTEPITFNEDGTRNVRQERFDEFAWNNGQGIGQLSQATLALSTNLNPKARDRERSTQDKILDSDLNAEDKEFLINNPETYVDFNIPWSLRINYNLGYRRRGFEDSDITQSLRFSGDFSLSEKWKITFNSGYDVEEKEFTQTNLGISRDLHCWEMNFNWTPFGRFTSYDFTIRVKSALLQDLKLNRTRSFFDRSF